AGRTRDRDLARPSERTEEKGDQRGDLGRRPDLPGGRRARVGDDGDDADPERGRDQEDGTRRRRKEHRESARERDQRERPHAGEQRDILPGLGAPAAEPDEKADGERREQPLERG